jgi:hypothetical protein
MKDKRMKTEETELVREEKYKEKYSEYEEIAGEEIVNGLWFISRLCQLQGLCGYG